ncbi:hypothetical protein X777_12745 [Ooceraea biroi]|uniref:Uncharacterized protein n=1 Tax=Ooceraea biroi TaxID=2015173 RepID=A0A026W189_OOCBI|nr:hypothetical protein X777_12745 [Ooceraea biroi]
MRKKCGSENAAVPRPYAGAALFGRVSRCAYALQCQATTASTAGPAAAARCAERMPLLVSRFHRERRPGHFHSTAAAGAPSRCTRPTPRQQVLPTPLPSAPPPSEPARERRRAPRGGNCPEAIQPPHSSADRATSTHGIPTRTRREFRANPFNRYNRRALANFRSGRARNAASISSLGRSTDLERKFAGSRDIRRSQRIVEA